MAELNFAAQLSRTIVFDATVAALQKEFSTRLQLLHSRKGDIERLQALSECLEARGWKARPDVLVMQFSGVIFRMHITFDSDYHRSKLFEYFARECIECSRNPAHDAAGDPAYDIVLGGGLKITLRLAAAKRPSSPAAA